MLNEIKDWGGGEVLTLDLASSLLKNGVDITLGCNRGSILSKKAEEAGIPIIVFPMRNEIDIFAVIYMVNLIHRDNFDVIHCHTMRDHVLGALAGKYSGKSLVVRTQHIHFPENPSFMAKLAYTKWTDKIICNSEYTKKSLEKSGIDSCLLEVVYNGIDFEKFKCHAQHSQKESIYSEFGLTRGDIIIGSVGSLFKTKGHEYLLKAFPGVLEKYPDSKLIVVGDGPERANLELISANLGIKEHVVFAGFREDVPEIIGIFDVMVVPSVWEEPFGLVNIEAMYSGVPLVATDVGGIPEIVKNDYSGVLVKPKSEEAIKQAVFQIIGNKEYRNKIKKNAKNEILLKFSIENTSKNMINIYQDLLLKSQTPVE
ncbi:MAG: glycosyltransferase family 4 protein [Candidatus Eremiobacteraeota bacterium]|nr:glycosyltransferase family 4 protein [Candidatus Eremiobacteraeota bacterium]